ARAPRRSSGEQSRGHASPAPAAAPGRSIPTSRWQGPSRLTTAGFRILTRDGHSSQERHQKTGSDEAIEPAQALGGGEHRHRQSEGDDESFTRQRLPPARLGAAGRNSRTQRRQQPGNGSHEAGIAFTLGGPQLRFFAIDQTQI